MAKLRTKRGLSQEDVINDTGINIGRIESGLNNLSITQLKLLCDYYEISLSDFFFDLGEK